MINSLSFSLTGIHRIMAWRGQGLSIPVTYFGGLVPGRTAEVGFGSAPTL